jgi:zinc/manganese transport system permease protein
MHIDELFQFHFMTNALIAGTLVAVMASAIGWFMVVRQQTFAGHTLSLIAFPGAAAAALAGAPVFVGYFAACGAGALALSAVSGGNGDGATRSLSHESAAIGSVQAFALGLGFLFVSLYHGLLNGLDSLLFGTFLGITDGQVAVLGGATVLVLGTLTTIGRPLFFASVDADVARASGVPVAALATGFLVLLGLAVAATSQITGALLVFALLVLPPATAQLITARPARSLVLSVVLGLLTVWVALFVAFYSPYPIGFWLTTVAFGGYVLVAAARRVRPRTLVRAAA